MKKVQLSAALLLGAMLVATGSFADSKDPKVTRGAAEMIRLGDSGHQYILSCNPGNIICYTRYSDGSYGINYRGSIIAAYPASFSPEPVLTPVQDQPDTYTMENAITVELAPGQQVQLP